MHSILYRQFGYFVVTSVTKSRQTFVNSDLFLYTVDYRPLLQFSSCVTSLGYLCYRTW